MNHELSYPRMVILEVFPTWLWAAYRDDDGKWDVHIICFSSVTGVPNNLEELVKRSADEKMVRNKGMTDRFEAFKQTLKKNKEENGESLAVPIRKLMEVREQIQEDICSLYDGESQESLDGLCQIVVDNFKSLLSKTKWENLNHVE